MIFDFYLSIDFHNRSNPPYYTPAFRDESMYRDIEGNEVNSVFENAYVTYLHRRNYSDSVAFTSDIKLWVFGYVFSNKLFATKENSKPRKLVAEEIIIMYNLEPVTFVNRLKGSYVLVLLDKSKNEVRVITDRLNVLPLYFAYDKGRLIISSNTSLILKTDWVDKEPDGEAMLMQNLFDYLLGEYYFIKGIRRFENAGIYTFNRTGLDKQFYWDVSNLYHEKLLPEKDSLDLLAGQLKENVNLYTSDTEKVLVSLTGGFDGRANIAMINKPKDNFLCYSYGMPGSKQIAVPRDIANKLDLNYRPILLNKNFLENYYENTLKATYFSNGIAPVGFCNIPYAYQSIKSYSDTILTGLFGSEILRPIHNNGIQINNQTFDIFLSNSAKEGVSKAVDRIKYIQFFSEEYSNREVDALIRYFHHNYFLKYSEYNKITRFFFFIIQEGIRKYFSQEISLERVFVTTRFPYFDTDLVDLIYQTPWAGMYNGFLGESKYKRRKGQLLYAHIIRKYQPELGSIILDRGYTPNDLLLPVPLNYFKIGYGYYKEKKYMKRAGGNDTFNTEIWAQKTLGDIVSSSGAFTGNLFGNRLGELFQTSNYFKSFLTFRHLVSIKAFFDITAL